jgi:hypothetical protein
MDQLMTESAMSSIKKVKIDSGTIIIYYELY